MKKIRELMAAKKINAEVILKDGRQVATVQTHYGNSGTVRVDVYGTFKLIYQGKAGGVGYDKRVAALAGAEIDGVKIHDHCGTDKETEAILEEYHSGKIGLEEAEERADKIGAGFANWNNKTGKFSSLHYYSGLRRLKVMGYTVIRAI